VSRYPPAVRAAFETLIGLIQLAVWVARSGWSGPYWAWRRHTAFGEQAPTRRETARTGLELARWIGRMRALR